MKIGQRVILSPNDSEGWPMEYATIVGIESNGLVMVEVEQHDPEDDADGLREVTLDQIREQK